MSHQIVPFKYYLGTFVSLVFLTIITVVVALFDFGAFDIVVAMGIAGVKASLVMLYFMGLRWDSGFSGILFVSSILVLALFLGLTFTDIGYRDMRHPDETIIHSIESPVKIIDESKGYTH